MITLTQDQRNRLIFAAVATVVTLAVIWFGLIRLQLSQRARWQSQIAVAETKLNDSRRLTRSSDRFAEELATQQTALEEIESGMAPASQASYAWMRRKVNRFKEGEETAPHAGTETDQKLNKPYKVDVQDYSTPVIGEVGLLPAFPYQAASCSIRGSAFFHELGRFLADFENTFPYVRVQNLELFPSVSGTGPGEEPEKLTFNCDLVALVTKLSQSP